MEKIRYIYLAFMVISLILSFFRNKKDRGLFIFPILLTFSLLTEILVYTLHHFKYDYNFIYHIYVPLEYSLLALYFYINAKSVVVKKMILFSIPLYLVVCFIMSVGSTLEKHPSFQINAEGVLLILWAIISLFSIDVRTDIKITSLPIFWICVAVLIYHSGIFTLTGIYNYIFETKSQLTNRLNIYILQISNYILYICLSIAFICSHQTKKY